jgi:large subunit ribosomal protein L29
VISLKADDIRKLDDEQMAKTLAETREELFNLRFQHATGALESTARIKAVRRDVARLLTAQRAQTPKET